jgi:hypothetical protein
VVAVGQRLAVDLDRTLPCKLPLADAAFEEPPSSRRIVPLLVRVLSFFLWFLSF